ncbi:MAG: lipid-A-disaccharide synthase [Bryobacterales bacterium]|nr:lipid-A-disaccharide synthase [Bryobacterales bacterium]
MRVLVSAGEASGDRYAAQLVEALRRRWPEAEFYGCTGPRMREAGVRTVVDTASLAVVGLVEVVAHIPRIYREFRKIVRTVREQRPDFAILTDSPDFHLRLATKLKRLGIPVFYLVAPQVWAWRRGRVKTMRRVLDHVFCIFPFEEEFFRIHGVPATYIGHPLAAVTRPALTKEAFFRKHRLPEGRPLVTLLPGSRRGEAARHLPPLLDAVDRLYRERALSFILPASTTTGAAFFRERIAAAPIQVIEGETADAIAHAGVALAASGTVTIEAALLGTPMVTFYRVTALSWTLGKLLVDIPFYCMVNLVAGTKVVPELMQSEMTGERLAGEVARLLDDAAARSAMRAGLAEVAQRLTVDGDPIEHAAAWIEDRRREFANHVS